MTDDEYFMKIVLILSLICNDVFIGIFRNLAEYLQNVYLTLSDKIKLLHYTAMVIKLFTTSLLIKHKKPPGMRVTCNRSLC